VMDTNITPKVTIGPAPPIGQVPGDFWYNNVNGFLFIWYDDGNTAQWVVANPGRGSSLGPQGPPGVTGPAGPQGPLGPAGPEGPLGPAGSAGPQGTQGINGPPGPDGPQGPQGVQGVVGPQGVQGPGGQSTTIVGSFGVSKTPADLPANGLIPINWDAPGSPATAFQMTVGDSLIYTGANTGPWLSGDLFVFTNTGTTSPAGWHDVGNIQGPSGPQGVAGAPGAQGPQGTQGPQGIDGPQGPTGPTGTTGAQGPTGPTGLTGPQGAAGPTGLTGPQGVKGDIGNTGPQGPVGGTGPQGPIGNTGPQGVKGDTGPQGPGITDAPSDGNSYIRKNAAWAAPGILQLVSEQVLAAPATILAVTVPSGAKRIEFEYYIFNPANVDFAAVIQLMQGATPVATAIYQYQWLLGSGITPSAQNASGQNFWNLGTGANFSGDARMRLVGSLWTGVLQEWITSAGGVRYMLNSSLDANIAGVTGFRLLSNGGAISLGTGSFMRCYAVI